MDPAALLSLPFLNRKQLDFEGATTFALDLDVVGHAADTIEVRGLTKAGVFKYTQEITGDGTIENFKFPIPDVPIMVSVALQSTPSTTVLAHGILYLAANQDRVAILAQGMINSVFGIAWPHALPPNREQSEGAIVEILIDNPAAGANVTPLVGANEVWEVLGISLQLAASAQAANRTIAVNFQTGNGFEFTRKSGTAQTANQTIKYFFQPGGSNSVITAAAEQEVGLPPRIFLPPLSGIAFTVANIDGSDQISNLSILVRRSYRAIVND